MRTQVSRYEADHIDSGEHDEACEFCGGEGCERCGGRGLVSASVPDLDAPITADPQRLVDHLVRVALQAVARVEAEPFGERGTLLVTDSGREHLAAVVRERMAQAAQAIVAELDEARSHLAGEVTARQFAAWASAQDRDGAPRVHQWRDSEGWHVALYVIPHGSDMLRVTEAVAPDPQDALTMLMAGRVAS
jgi:hypothetical protein